MHNIKWKDRTPEHIQINRSNTKNENIKSNYKRDF